MDNHTTDWGEGQSICAKDLSYFGALCREGILLDAEGELVPLDRQVIETVTSGELLSQQLPDLDANAENFSEKMAIFGGSWSFGLLFIGILIVLMMLNSLVFLVTPFESYPFILLNLFLSSLAALQAPIIMMSQRRQEIKDRISAENDYMVNLKAELEIRQLHEKLDHHIGTQDHKLNELRRVQISFMHDQLDRLRQG